MTRQIGRLVGADRRRVTVELAPGTKFSFDLDDPYWNRLVSPRYHYEPELEQQLLVWRNQRWLFLDCGANYGYWSVLVSSSEFGGQDAVAVEASSTNFERLVVNRRLNGNRFVAKRAAVAATAGVVHSIEMPQSGVSHSALRARPKRSEFDRESAPTVLGEDVVSCQCRWRHWLKLTFCLDTSLLLSN